MGFPKRFGKIGLASVAEFALARLRVNCRAVSGESGTTRSPEGVFDFGTVSIGRPSLLCPMSRSWEHAESGHSQTGINEIDAILGKGHNLETVKPLRLFEKIVQLWCPPDGLVIDPFAGSGTTGHAVLSL
jgi:hypothetical protein